MKKFMRDLRPLWLQRRAASTAELPTTISASSVHSSVNCSVCVCNKPNINKLARSAISNVQRAKKVERGSGPAAAAAASGRPPRATFALLASRDHTSPHTLITFTLLIQIEKTSLIEKKNFWKILKFLDKIWTCLVKVESVDLVRVPAEGWRRLGGVHGCVPPPCAPTGGTLTDPARAAPTTRTQFALCGCAHTTPATLCFQSYTCKTTNTTPQACIGIF